jgi:hypothetical protein
MHIIFHTIAILMISLLSILTVILLFNYMNESPAHNTVPESIPMPVPEQASYASHASPTTNIIKQSLPHLPQELTMKYTSDEKLCSKPQHINIDNNKMHVPSYHGYNYNSYVNNGCSNDNIDPNLFYASKLQIVKTILEDPITRGYNFTQYGNFGNIMNIGRIILEKTDSSAQTYARPSNYIFENSPAYKR